MFRDDYVCRLGQNGRLALPKDLREELLDDGEGGRERNLVFAVADALRLYPERNLPEYMDEMKRQKPNVAAGKAYRSARCSFFGQVRIPGAFLEHCGFAPGDELLLRGRSGFFELGKLRRFPVISPGLQGALHLDSDSVSELEAEDARYISIENELCFPTGELRPFHALRHLRLQNCGVSDLGFLEFLPELVRLDLRGNRISDVGPLRRLKRLGSLHIAENPVVSLEAVGDLKELESLMAFRCEIADVPFLPAACGLQTLHLSDNRIADLEFLRCASGLKDLFVSRNEIRDLGPLAGKENLQYLHFADNGVKDISVLLALPELVAVNAVGNPIQKSAIQRLTVHCICNAFKVSGLPESAYENKRRSFFERFSEDMQDDALLETLFELIHVPSRDEVLRHEEKRYAAKTTWDARPLERAVGKLGRMRDAWCRDRVLEWIGRQEAVRIPVRKDYEECFSPGKPGSLRFSLTPGGGIVGPGEPYTIDRSDYVEVNFFQKWQ